MRTKMVALLTGAILMMATSAMATIIVNIGSSSYTTVNKSATYDFIQPSNSSLDFPKFNIVDFILDGQLGGSDHTYTLVNSTTSSPSKEDFFGAGGGAVLVKEIAGNKDTNTFGYYTESPTATHQLFNGPAGSGAVASFVLTPAQNFGFFIGAKTGNFYTQQSLNYDGAIHAAIFQVDNLAEYIVAFEDVSNGDNDFQDMVVNVSVVPEPGTMMLLGIGMLGMAVYGKRRMNKEA